jgi:uncharacterized protein YjdB
MKAVTCVGILILASLTWGCGAGGTHSQTTTSNQSSTPTVLSLQVSPGSVAIATGGSKQFFATANFSDGTSGDVSNTVTWTSSDTSIASVSAKGLASGIGWGTARINAQTGNAHASATLSVSNAAANLKSITISPASSSMPVNTSQQFTASGTYNDGSSADLTNLVAWSSYAMGIAKVSASGMVTALAAGSTNITASLAGVSQTTGLTVTAPSIASITVTPDGLTLGIGINQQFVATAIYTDGTSADLSRGVSWNSSSPSVATVDTTGLAATVGAGSTTITATVGSFSDTSVLTVVPAHLVSISVGPSNPSIAVGTTEQFSAVGNFDDGSTQLLTSLAWSSTSGSVARVDANGLATGAATGSTTITATSGSVTGSTSLSVTGASLVSIAVTPANSSMATGTTKQFTATGTFSDSSMQNVSDSVLWSSSNPAAATVASTGLVTSMATGSTTISAAFGNASGSTALTISTAHLVGIAINPANPRISARTSIQFTATGTFSDGSSGGNLAGVSWKSSKPNIASVRSSGIAHGKKGGTATITASASGVSGTTALTVGTGTLSSVAISPANPTCSQGTTQQFSALGTFSDGSSQDISLNSHWSSSSASVASIANAPSVAGLAQCLGVGATAIGANSGGTSGSTELTVQ